ncbi:hypothetical protein AB1N83_012215 [Pleurotus pulmonarius]
MYRYGLELLAMALACALAASRGGCGGGTRSAGALGMVIELELDGRARWYEGDGEAYDLRTRGRRREEEEREGEITRAERTGEVESGDVDVVDAVERTLTIEASCLQHDRGSRLKTTLALEGRAKWLRGYEHGATAAG